jgi:hypothetical protein
VWISPSPLRVGFPRLYDICEDRDISIVECAGVNWQLHFRRMLNPEAFEDWKELQEMPRGVLLSSESDKVSWGLTKKKVFTTGSLYRFVTHRGVNSKMARRIWKCKIPLKIRIFIWQVL